MIVDKEELAMALVEALAEIDSLKRRNTRLNDECNAVSMREARNEILLADSQEKLRDALLWLEGDRSELPVNVVQPGLTLKELKLAASLLDMASSEFGNHGCNDWDFPGDWTDEEKRRIVKEFHQWNGDPEEYDPLFTYLPDFGIMGFMAKKLEECAKELTSK